MPKQIQLTIAEPCHEDWDKMTPSEKGRFCGSCQKQVVDFTRMSNSQLAAFFRKKSTGSVCGRFMEDQLDKNILVPRKRIPWIKYFFQFSIPLFLVSVKLNAQKGQVKVKETTTEEVNITMGFVASPRMPQKTKQLSNEIKGRVVDEQGKPVPFASIMIAGSPIGTAADSNGSFSVVVPAKMKQYSLEVSSVGFETKNVSENEVDESGGLTVKLNTLSLPDVLVTGYEVTRCTVMMGAVSTVMSIAENTIPLPVLPPIEPQEIRLYPNPVSKGGAITVDLKTGSPVPLQVKVISLDGKLLFLQSQKDVKNAGRFTIQTNSRWPSGVYIVQVIDEKGILKHSEKLVIQ